ncbi:MAG TPA: LacI family DNA-binding transcriptional regulator [Arenibaculum sp.]|nr:LacI family DNA-binding transcriptional regulator [Arenibaculum sp.]
MASRRAHRKSTIYDIATATKASPSTVSMVLNGTWQRYRISETTANRVLETARELGYKLNMRARGLRLARSGLVGMVIPHYRNRFFAGLSETFEAGARARGVCPIVVSAQRDPATEREVVEALLSHQVEFLFIAGVGRPEPLNELCRAAGVPCVNLDLPGSNAPSVVTDNRAGARMLTDTLIAKMGASGRVGDGSLHFLGGVPDEYATEERLAGFAESLAAHDIAFDQSCVHRCGYWPAAACTALASLHRRLGGLPGGLFVNSITAFEGAVRFFQSLDGGSFDGRAIGCFDWDPFAAVLPFPVTMMRQDVEAMIEQAFACIEDWRPGWSPMIRIPPKFGPTRSLRDGPS